MPLLIPAPRSLQPKHGFSLSLPLPHLPPLSLTLSGDVPCVSWSEQRKPKTRRILLKGVSRQPDINTVLVCRAESKPLGLCGFIRVRARVSQHLLGIHLHVSRLPFVPWSIPDAWNDTRSANCGSIEPILHRCVCVPCFFFYLTSRHGSPSSAASHMRCKVFT